MSDRPAKTGAATSPNGGAANVKNRSARKSTASASTQGWAALRSASAKGAATGTRTMRAIRAGSARSSRQREFDKFESI